MLWQETAPFLDVEKPPSLVSCESVLAARAMPVCSHQLVSQHRTAFTVIARGDYFVLVEVAGQISSLFNFRRVILPKSLSK